MPRTYGLTNAAPWATAPPVGAAGDSYYNTTDKTLYLSNGTAWVAVGGTDEVWIGPDTPAGAQELWYDTDEPAVLSDDMRWYTAWGRVIRSGSSNAPTSGATPLTALSFTVPLVAGRQYAVRVMSLNTYATVAGDTFGVQVTLDGSATGLDPFYISVDYVNNYIAPVMFDVPLTASTGTHTIAIVVTRAGGGGLMQCRYFAEVHDLGPATGSTPSLMSVSDRWNAAWGQVAKATALVGQTGIAQAWTEIANTRVTFTSIAGRRYLLSGAVEVQASQGTGGWVQIYDVTNSLEVAVTDFTMGAANYVAAHALSADVMPGAGTKTYCLRGYSDAGTIATLAYGPGGSAGPTLRVQDVGPVTGAVPAPNPTPAWQNLTLVSGWTAYGAPYLTPQYRLIGDEVELRGAVKNATAMTLPSPSTVTTLPVGYRPPGNQEFGCAGGGSDGWFAPLIVEVASNGTVTIFRTAQGAAAPHAISTLDAIRFSVSA
jgi:hypothetical protein